MINFIQTLLVIEDVSEESEEVSHLLWSRHYRQNPHEDLSELAHRMLCIMHVPSILCLAQLPLFADVNHDFFDLVETVLFERPGKL